MYSPSQMTTFLKNSKLTFEQIKKFLIENEGNQNIYLEPIMKKGIRKLIVQYVNSFIRSNNSSEVYSPNLLPQSWSDRELVKHACHLMEYQGLQLTFNSAPNHDAFENNYIEFMQDYQSLIQNSIKNGNLLIAYLHVVKLFREINKLNKQLIASNPLKPVTSQTMFNTPVSTSASSNKILDNKILEQLKIAEEELLTSVIDISTVISPENQFWTNAIIALGLHTMASMHYIANNPEAYNLEKAKQLLDMATKACDEGKSSLEQLEDSSFVKFYTLQYSLMSALPYQSFDDEKKAILDCLQEIGGTSLSR